jgi:hypothetical protein
MSRLIRKAGFYWATVTAVWSAASVAAASGLPLQVGVYSAGSRYIQIAAQDDRVCYQGFSANGSVVGAIAPDSEMPGFYRVNGLPDLVLHQPTLEAILLGSVHELRIYAADPSFPREISPMLQQCLNTKAAFFKRMD